MKPNHGFIFFNSPTKEKVMFKQLAEVRAKHEPEFWGTGYVVDVSRAFPSRRIVFWVGDAGDDGTARCLMMFHIDNLTEVS